MFAKKTTEPAHPGRRTRRMVATLVAVLAVVAPMTATVRALGAGPASATSILVVRSEGGFVPAYFDVRQPPRASLMSDGRLYRPGAMTMEYPGPALVPITVARLGRSERAAVDRLAHAAGLHRRDRDLGRPPTADVPDLVITYRGVTTRIASYGVGEELLPRAQRDARLAVARLLSRVDGFGGAVVPPTAVVAAIREATSGDAGDGITPGVLTWQWRPLAETSCVVIAEPAAVDALSGARETTQYRSEGRLWRVFARPMVPGDAGCPR